MKRETSTSKIFLLLLLNLSCAFCYDYKTLYYKQVVDHFGFENHDTFLQKYLISTKNWNSTSSGPIFFYCGNEGAIESFANNTGLMWDLAPEFGAMVVFAEHRYYGKSFPYPKEKGKLGYLTSEQALADHAKLVIHLKKTIAGASKSPVVAFGGSYGGMLASWMRIKYPHVIDGAIAASAPVIQFSGMVPCDAYSQSVTKAYRWGGDQCPDVIKKALNLIVKVGSTEKGLAMLTRIFRLCKPLEDKQFLLGWINEALSDVAMANYPYPNTFLGSLPAWPVKKMCSFMKDSTASDEAVLKGIFHAMSVYYNQSSLQPKCIDFSVSPISALGAENWGYQACTEMIMPMCSTGINDMFLPNAWNLTMLIQGCRMTYGVMARPYMVETMYGGDKLQYASNIIFSNGEIDPWSGGGIHKNINPTVIAISIKDGAHHLDLRASNKLDPPSVIQARNIEKKWMKIWINQARKNNKD